MAVYNVSVFLVISSLLLVVYRYFISPALLSPLSKVPAPHWSCHFSSAWLLWMKYTQQENVEVYKNHLKRGEALRLTPNILSLNGFEGGLKPIYGGGFPKTDFYFTGFSFYETHNIFTFPDNASHSARKRLVSNTFSKSTILTSETVAAAIEEVLFKRLMPLIEDSANKNQPLEILDLNYAYAMDVFVHWQFGRSIGSNFLQDEKERRMYLNAWFGLASVAFWQWNFGGLVTWLKLVGIHLIPKTIDAGFQDIANWNLEKCDQAKELVTGNREIPVEEQPTIFAQAFRTMSLEKNMPDVKRSAQSYPQRLEIAGDMGTHNSAAFETAGDILSYTYYELSRNPDWQNRLRSELSQLTPPLVFPVPRDSGHELPLPKDIDSLPLLDSILMETLRLYAPVPGAQPRMTPKVCSLGGHHNIPAGTTVQCYAYSLHRRADVFPDPETWRPERWLDASPDELSSMRKYFWAFGSGGRMCLGSHFGIHSMKEAIATIYTNYSTSIHDHGDMAMVDSYIGGPKGRRLVLNFSRIS